MTNNDKGVHPIYWAGGSKGGVGKSMMTIATVDYLPDRGDKVLLVECDTSNPDVWNAYQQELQCELIELDEADGWIDFVNMCDQHGDSVIVVNTAARNNMAVRQHGPTLGTSLDELGAKLVALWMINRQRDSLELLKDLMAAMPKADVHVVRNGYFGDERKFELYRESKIREAVEGREASRSPYPSSRIGWPMTSMAKDFPYASPPRPFRLAIVQSLHAGVQKCAKCSPRWSCECGGIVRENRRTAARRRRARAALPPARGPRAPRQRRVLGHRGGPGVLRLVLSRVPFDASPRRRSRLRRTPLPGPWSWYTPETLYPNLSACLWSTASCASPSCSTLERM
jgi:hypothetical protein